jgi:quercetin dioxygenase-like cupin family protein
MGYSKLNVEDVEGAGPGGAFHFVRRELGVLAFGVNWVELKPGAEGHEHDERDSGQEEVNVVVAGSGTYRVDGETIPVRTGDFLRFDPETTRCPIAGPDGLTLVAVGAPRGSYEPRGPY